MKKISLFALLLSISYVSTAPADKKADGSTYAPEWGVEEQLLCKGSGVQAGWGDYADKSSLKFAWAMMDNKSDGNTGYGAIYYVARKMTPYGYMFCPTVIAADRDGGCTKEPNTEYFNVNGTKTGCFWLCADGRYGDGCDKTDFQAEDKVSLDAHIKRQEFVPENYHVLYDIKKHTLFANIEENIPMLMYDKKGECGTNQRIDLNSNKKQEHDTVLAIRKIVVDKDNNSVTYTIQPLAVRAGGYTGCYRKGDDAAWPMLQWTGKEKSTFCPSSGFLHKEKGAGGCYFTLEGEEAQSQAEQSAYKAAQTKAQSLEESGLAILCQGFDRAKYDNKVHVLNSKAFEYQNWRTVGETQYNVSKEDVLRTSIGTKEEYIGAKDKEEYVNTKCANDPARTACERFHEDQYDKLSKEYDEKKVAASDAYNDTQTGATATCTVFVCKDEGMGYASDPMVSGDFTCVSCAENSDKTIHPLRLGRGSDGICKVCKVGEIVKNGQCEKSKSIHKFYMDGMNKKTSGEIKPVENLADQCWTKPTPDEYKACIKGLGVENSGGENNGIIPPLNKGPDGLVVSGKDFGGTVSK